MSKRLETLDVIRGFALCGIAFVNFPPIAGIYAMPEDRQVRDFLDLFVQERFFPIFSLVFGLSFGLLARSTRRKYVHPRRVLARRFLLLIVFGGVHQLLQPGEALLFYGLAAMVVLLPLEFVPERYAMPLAVGAGILLTGIGGAYGGLGLIPGLFLLGHGASLCGVPRLIERAGIWVWPLILLGSAASFFLVREQMAGMPESSMSAIGSYTGLCLAGTYVAIIVGLMATPVRPVLTAFFAPLGRTALTNYIGATLVFHFFVLVLDAFPGTNNARPGDDDLWVRMMLLVLAMLVIQSLVSRLWLYYWKQGPLEKAWRWLTHFNEPKVDQ